MFGFYMKYLLLNLGLLFSSGIQAQKYYSYSFDAGSLDIGYSIIQFNGKFYIATDYENDSLVIVNNHPKMLEVEIDNPSNYKFKEYNLDPNAFFSSHGQGLTVDSKGNKYLVGTKPYDLDTSVASCIRIRSDGSMDWIKNYQSLKIAKINTVIYINDNSLLLLSEEAVYNKYGKNHLIWIDSTGTIIKEKLLPENGNLFNEYNFLYSLTDSGFYNAASGTHKINGVSYTWLHLRKLDKDGNVVWDTLDYKGKNELLGLGSPTLNGNFIGSKYIDSIYLFQGINKIHPIIVGLYDSLGKKISEEKVPDVDSVMVHPNFMFPLKNGDVLMLGYGEYYYNASCDKGICERGFITRISPKGKFKWWRYIYDTNLTELDRFDTFFDGVELENGDLAFTGAALAPEGKGDANIWLLKTDSMGCITPGCTGKSIVLGGPNNVKESHEEKEIFFKVFPNPVSEQLTVYFYNQIHRGNSKICLMNDSGVIITTQNIKNGDESLTLPVKNEPTGTYYIQYRSNELILQNEEIIIKN